jgi:putative transposase
MRAKQKIEIAVFRFGVINEFVNGIKLGRGEQERMIQEKCDRKWIIPYSNKSSISRSTILRWIKLYKESGGNLEILYPKSRSDRGKGRAMDEETSLSLIRLREELPNATVPRLIRKMKQRRLFSPDVHLNLSTVYRFLHQQNLMEHNKSKPEDRRRFEAELPNDIWQSDVMHGPRVKIGNKMRKSYLIAFIDDHSRLLPYGAFYASESAKSFMDAFKKALIRRGLPRKLYVDNGAAYRSKHLEYTAASLGIALIHARPYKPQGKGKIERIFKTVRSQFLTEFKGEHLFELNDAFEKWLTDVYHQRKHSSTAQTPFKRFTSKMECLRSAPDNLKDHFRKKSRRRVSSDRTITLNNNLYQAPLELIGKQVDVLYHEEDMTTVEVKWNQKTYGILPRVDLHLNCKVKRDRNNQVEISTEESKPESGRIWE